MFQIPIGIRAERKVLVTRDLLIDFLGSEDLRVFSTPNLILQLEWTARDLVKPYLAPEEDTVGTRVEVSHLAPVPHGTLVRFIAEVIAVQGRRVEFKLEAYDEVEKVAEGTHQRYIIDKEWFRQRLTEKRSRIVEARKQTAASVSNSIWARAGSNSSRHP